MENLFDSDSVYFTEVERFINWCRDNSLDLNVKKTKELLIDFRKAPTVIPDLFMDGVKVERVTFSLLSKTVPRYLYSQISRNSLRQQAEF